MTFPGMMPNKKGVALPHDAVERVLGLLFNDIIVQMKGCLATQLK